MQNVFKVKKIRNAFKTGRRFASFQHNSISHKPLKNRRLPAIFERFVRYGQIKYNHVCSFITIADARIRKEK